MHSDWTSHYFLGYFFCLWWLKRNSFFSSSPLVKAAGEWVLSNWLDDPPWCSHILGWLCALLFILPGVICRSIDRGRWSEKTTATELGRVKRDAAATAARLRNCLPSQQHYRSNCAVVLRCCYCCVAQWQQCAVSSACGPFSNKDTLCVWDDVRLVVTRDLR